MRCSIEAFEQMILFRPENTYNNPEITYTDARKAEPAQRKKGLGGYFLGDRCTGP